MELLNRDYILRHFTPRDEKVIAGMKVVEEREFDFLTSRIHGKIYREDTDGTVTKETHWRLYAPYELKNILEDIGFLFAAGYGGLDRQPLDLETRLMKLIFKKKYDPDAG